MHGEKSRARFALDLRARARVHVHNTLLRIRGGRAQPAAVVCSVLLYNFYVVFRFRSPRSGAMSPPPNPPRWAARLRVCGRGGLPSAPCEAWRPRAGGSHVPAAPSPPSSASRSRAGRLQQGAAPSADAVQPRASPSGDAAAPHERPIHAAAMMMVGARDDRGDGAVKRPRA